MSFLDKLSKGYKNVMIMGDFNVNLINCNDDRNISNILDAMLSHSLLPFITTPTRITINTKKLTDKYENTN